MKENPGIACEIWRYNIWLRWSGLLDERWSRLTVVLYSSPTPSPTLSEITCCAAWTFGLTKDSRVMSSVKRQYVTAGAEKTQTLLLDTDENRNCVCVVAIHITGVFDWAAEKRSSAVLNCPDPFMAMCFFFKLKVRVYCVPFLQRAVACEPCYGLVSPGDVDFEGLLYRITILLSVLHLVEHSNHRRLDDLYFVVCTIRLNS